MGDSIPYFPHQKMTNRPFVARQLVQSCSSKWSDCGHNSHHSFPPHQPSHLYPVPLLQLIFNLQTSRLFGSSLVIWKTASLAHQGKCLQAEALVPTQWGGSSTEWCNTETIPACWGTDYLNKKGNLHNKINNLDMRSDKSDSEIPKRTVWTARQISRQSKRASRILQSEWEY